MNIINICSSYSYSFWKGWFVSKYYHWPSTNRKDLVSEICWKFYTKNIFVHVFHSIRIQWVFKINLFSGWNWTNHTYFQSINCPQLCAPLSIFCPSGCEKLVFSPILINNALHQTNKPGIYFCTIYFYRFSLFLSQGNLF